MQRLLFRPILGTFLSPAFRRRQPAVAMLPRLGSHSLFIKRRQTSTVEPPNLCAAPPPATPATPADAAGGAPKAEQEELMDRLSVLPPEDRRLILEALFSFKQPPKEETTVNKELDNPQAGLGGPGYGPRRADMVAAFTCGRCDHRMVKKFSKHAYTKGIIIVECSSCRVKHLLADNLGWFTDEARNIEDILREKGESFIRIGADEDYQVVPQSAEKLEN